LLGRASGVGTKSLLQRTPVTVFGQDRSHWR
jgi:hypothetical protein